MSYRCSVCNEVTAPGDPLRKRIVYRATPITGRREIEKEHPICYHCELSITAAGTGEKAFKNLVAYYATKIAKAQETAPEPVRRSEVDKPKTAPLFQGNPIALKGSALRTSKVTLGKKGGTA